MAYFSTIHCVRNMFRVTPLVAALALSATPAWADTAFTFVTIDYPGATGTSVNGISNTGSIIGNASGWTTFIDTAGSFSTFQVPGYNTNIFAINASGVIAGSYEPTYASTPRSAFIYDGTNLSQFSYAPGISTIAQGINDAGWTVGQSYLSNGYAYSGFIRDPNGNVNFFDVPNSTWTVTTGINNGGDTTGIYATDSQHGFVNIGGTLTSVDVPGANSTELMAINSADEAVGTYLDSNGVSHGLVFTSDGFYTLDDPYGMQTWLTGINDAGVIVGTYVDGNGINHGFEADPVPEPVTLVLLGPSLLVLGAIRHKIGRIMPLTSRAAP